MLTSIQIFKVQEKDTYYMKKLVNSVDLHDMHFALQAIEIKKLIRDYQPKEVLIDGTGVGVGLMDFLVLDQFDDKTGELLPGVASMNNEDYMKYPGNKIIYLLKATSGLNSEIHSTFYNQVMNGHCRFLISEQVAKTKLMATKRGAKMTPTEKMARLAPHMETTRLFEEVCNLRIKQTGANMMVERVNSRINKDRFSAAEYALWRIKAMEDEYFKSKVRKKIDFTSFVLFSKGG